jgi:hypothetical protein
MHNFLATLGRASGVATIIALATSLLLRSPVRW